MTDPTRSYAIKLFSKVTSTVFLDESITYVFWPDDYEKDLAPKHTRFGKRVDDPLPVYLGVDILSFDKIDTVNMMIR